MVHRTQASDRKVRAGVGGHAGARKSVGGFAAHAAADASESSSTHSTETAEFEELKIERLQHFASSLSNELAQLVAGAAKDQAVIFIDDFYYVRLDDQPAVLDYLQQVVKSTGI
jgi:hypothetical protein